MPFYRRIYTHSTKILPGCEYGIVLVPDPFCPGVASGNIQIFDQLRCYGNKGIRDCPQSISKMGDDCLVPQTSCQLYCTPLDLKMILILFSCGFTGETNLIAKAQGSVTASLVAIPGNWVPHSRPWPPSWGRWSHISVARKNDNYTVYLWT